MKASGGGRTIRDFKPDPVPDDVVHRILQAARWAPELQQHAAVALHRSAESRHHRRAWCSICTQGSFIGNAPLAIAVVMGETRRPQLDAGRALQQMELVAWSEGLGTCFVGIRGEQQDQVKTLLGIPEDMELITVLPFGYRIMRAGGHRNAAEADVGDNPRRAVRPGADVRVRRLPPLELRRPLLQERPPRLLGILGAVQDAAGVGGKGHGGFPGVLSRAARMMRLLIHCTMGGVRIMRSHKSRVVCSRSSDETR